MHEALALPAHKHDGWTFNEVLDWARGRREEWFKVVVPNDDAKLAFLRKQAHALAVQPFTIELASRLVQPFRADDWRRQAESLHRFVRDGIRYQRHPDGKQQVADDALWHGRGACTEKVLAVVALALALGIEADFAPMWHGDVMTHVQSAIRYPGSDRDPAARTSSERGAPAGKWLISDPTIAGAELGQDPTRLPRNPDTGRLPLA